MMKPFAIILAGGASSRMGGGDKSLRPLGGRSMLEHVVKRLAPQVGPLALSANGDPARFAAWGLDVVPDAIAGLGPLGGILAGLRWARQAEWLLAVPGDTPFLPPDLVARLAESQVQTGRPIVQAASAGKDHPAIALIATSLADDLAAALAQGTRAIRHWMAPHAPAVAGFATITGDPFLNINTPEDLAHAEQRLLQASERRDRYGLGG